MSVKDIINEIAVRIGCLENERHFTNNTGFSQVEGKSVEINREYGKYEELIDLYEYLTDTTWITKQH